MIKLFAFDLDGTLLDNNSNLSESSIEAIKKLDEAGIKVVLASGRVFPSIKYHQKKLGIRGPIVSTNGSLISLDGKEVYKSYPLDDEVLISLYEFALKHKLEFHFYDEENLYTNRLNLDRIDHLRIDNEYGLNYQIDLIIKKDPVSYLLDRGGKAIKFQMSGLDQNQIPKEKLLEILNHKYKDKAYITSSYDSLVEIGNKNATKWTSIDEICQVLGINKSEVAAIGDSYNDMPMVENSALGFAMGNANDSLKQLADIVVSDNESAGVLKAVNYVLGANRNV